MKLAVAIERFNPVGSAAERCAAQIVAELARHRHEVTVITSFCLGAPADGVQVQALYEQPRYRAPALRAFTRWAAGRVSDPRFDASMSMNLHVKGQVVMPLGGVTREMWRCQLASEPSAWRRLALRARLACSPRQRLLLKLEAATAADPAIRLVATTEALAQQLHHHHGVAAHRLVRIAPGAAQRSEPHPQQASWRQQVRQGLDIPDDATVYVAHGDAMADDGSMVLRAVKALVQQGVAGVLILAGGVSHRQHQRACELGVRDHVRFVGQTEHPAALLAAADVTIHLSGYDATGQTTIESLLAGRPVITTAGNALQPLIAAADQPPRGRVVTPADPADLAHAMAALADPHQRRQCQQAMRGLEEQWSITNHVDQLMQCLDRRTNA
jgi:glycosyltransferase involved in cell wall biosynthesis